MDSSQAPHIKLVEEDLSTLERMASQTSSLISTELVRREIRAAIERVRLLLSAEDKSTLFCSVDNPRNDSDVDAGTTTKVTNSSSGSAIDTTRNADDRNIDDLIASIESRNLTLLLTSVAVRSSNTASGSNGSNSALPKCREEALILVIYCFLLDAGFVALVEVPSTVAGFAPSLKEVPKDRVIPPNWSTELGTGQFILKHPNLPRKQFTLTLLTMGPLLLVTLAQKGGEMSTLSVSLSEHYDDQGMTSSSNGDASIEWFRGFKEIQDLRVKVYAQLTPFLGEQAPPSTNQSDPSRGKVSFVPRPAPTYPYPVYQPQPGGVGIPGSGSGMFVGPDHPIFTGGGSSGQGPLPGAAGGFEPIGPYPLQPPFFLPGTGGFGGMDGQGALFAPPRPRFDPLTPLASGPRGPFGGGGRGLPGARGGRSGRGLLPGEPDADHLRPPRGNSDRDGDDDMYI